MPIATDFIDELRRSTDIVQIIGEFTQLKRRGKNYLGLCPFHSERTPSFTVSAEKQLFYCFGCKEGGNLFTFIAKVEGLSFPESVKWIAEKAGKGLPPGFSSSPDDLRDVNVSLYDACKATAGLYRKFLLDSPSAESARRFLVERQIDPSISEEFQIGAAPDSWDFLLGELDKSGFTAELLVRAGLGIQSEGGRYRDFFRNRIIFPIWDFKGRVVGFGGRTLTSEEPKYLNSGENPIFQKGSLLYGFPQARDHIRARQKVVIVEGYVDLLACMGAGVRNGVAPLGTALTEMHARRLARTAKEVYLCFDQDEAGEQATWKSVEILRSLGFMIRVVPYSGAKDPDELVRRQGARALVQALQSAISWFEYLLKKLSERHDIKTPEGRSLAVRQIITFLATEKDPVLFDGYIDMAAATLKVRGAAIREQIERFRRSFSPYAAPHRKGEVISNLPHQTKEQKAEAWLLRLAFEHAEFLDEFRLRVLSKSFRDPTFQEIAERLAGGATPESLLSTVNADLQKALSLLLMADEPMDDPRRMFEDCVAALTEARREREKGALRDQLAEAERSQDASRIQQLTQELQGLYQR